MGYEAESWLLTVTLDAHAGDRERRDAALWDELRTALEALAAVRHYGHMVSDVMPEPSEIPPAVRWRAVLALLEAAERLATEDSWGTYVDVEDCREGLTCVRESAESQAFMQVGEEISPVDPQRRLIGGQAVTEYGWLQSIGRRP